MITIERIGSGRWRAIAHVGSDLGVVQGAQTKEGPWLDAEGSSPTMALRKLYQAIGEAYVTRPAKQTAD